MSASDRPPTLGSTSPVRVGSQAASGVDPRPVVLALCAWVATWLCVQGQPQPVAACGVAGLLALLCGWRRLLVRAAGLLLLTCLVTAGLRSFAAHTGPLPRWAGNRAGGER